MAEIREKRTVIHNIPVERPPVVENQHDYVVHERRGISGATMAALIIAAIAVGVLITLLIINSQQRSREDELAIERERAAAAERRAAQAQAPQQQQPSQPLVIVPPPQPSTVTIPAPSPTQPTSVPSVSPSPSSTSNISIEVNVNSKFLDDPQLRSYPITVKFESGAATLSGSVPNEGLKARAEKLAMSVKGVHRVVNNITVEQ